MNELLSDDQVRRYGKDGFLFPVRILGDSEAEHCRRRLLEVMYTQHNSPELKEFFYYKTHLVFRFMDELCHHPRLLDAIQDLLGRDLLLWNSSVLIKQSKAPTYFTWHQDSTYWGLEPPVALSVWLALTDVTRDAGCVRTIPGSHTLGQLAHENTFDKNVDLPRGQRVAVPFEESRAIDLCLRPGEMSVHHVRTIHGSGPNVTDGPRIGINMTFIPPSVRQTQGRESAMLIRGTDLFGHFDQEPRPDADLDSAARAAHRLAMSRMATRAMESAALNDSRRLAQSAGSPT
jgi:ectoine hydroxylase-related dioxygenase (phytanoyl-CoA dioxygenase family)